MIVVTQHLVARCVREWLGNVRRLFGERIAKAAVFLVDSGGDRIVNLLIFRDGVFK